MDLTWLDLFYPLSLVLVAFTSSYLTKGKLRSPSVIHTSTTQPELNVVPSPVNKAYSIGYNFQKEMLESEVDTKDISTYIEERTNPQGRFSNATQFSEFEKRSKDTFGNYKSWQGFKEQAGPEGVEQFNEGRQEAVKEYYTRKANEMAFEQSLDRSDKNVEALAQGMREVYLTHHATLDAHELFEEALKRIDQ